MVEELKAKSDRELEKIKTELEEMKKNKSKEEKERLIIESEAVQTKLEETQKKKTKELKKN